MTKFEEVYAINVNEFTEKKNNLTYLSWAYAVKEMTKAYPDWKYEIVKNENNIPVFGNPEMGYMVYTRITVGEETKEMWLPVLDYKNQPIKNPNIFQINTSIMRCLTKNTAMFGLGLYIYAGEDLPETEDNLAKNVSMQYDEEQKQQAAEQFVPFDGVLKLIDKSINLEELKKIWVQAYSNRKNYGDKINEIQSKYNLKKDTFLPPKEEQEKIYNSAINYISACASLERLNPYVKDNNDIWQNSLSSDLYADIKQAITQAKDDIKKGA